jgi:hypothetical protein
MSVMTVCREKGIPFSIIGRATVRIIKSRRMRWAGHVARIWEKRNKYRLFVGKPE